MSTYTNNTLHKRRSPKVPNHQNDDLSRATLTAATLIAAVAQKEILQQRRNNLNLNDDKVDVSTSTSSLTKHKIHLQQHHQQQQPQHQQQQQRKHQQQQQDQYTQEPQFTTFCCHDVNCRLNIHLHASPSPSTTSLLANRRSVSVEPITTKFNTITSSSSSTSSSGSRTSIKTSRAMFHPNCNFKDLNDDDVNDDHDNDNDVGGGDEYDDNHISNKIKNWKISVNSLLTNDNYQCTIQLKFDLISWVLFALAFVTRFYKLDKPPNVVFDELHYGKFISHYIRNVFFFDQHPPLGKQLIAAVAHVAGYNGNYTFPRIGAEYTSAVPIFWLRFLPALCGSALSPAVYKLLLQARVNRWCATLGGLLIILDNAMLTQSRFVLMESMLLLFCTMGFCFLLKFQESKFASSSWLLCGIASACFLTCTVSVKYVGFLSSWLAAYLMCRYIWDLLYDGTVSDILIVLQTVTRVVIFTVVPIGLYLSIFYMHLNTLHLAGPHDSVMTSAFQASLDGGLASITRGQPLKVVHGSQITLRHTHGRTCWLHSHAHVYPVRYPDKRGSSHQQQVTCYSFKDVNNWWIVKRPEREDLVVGDQLDVIRHGDIIQLVHGITSRALNSHDVAAPMTPQCQEVSCYIDYEIKMASELLWRVEILNRETEGDQWHAIKSEIRLIHQTTGAALRYSGRQLPEWGFNQHEVVADRTVEHKDAIWNVEEHRYTKSQNQREREQQLLQAEMIPTKPTKLTFWQKFIELQTKMFWHSKQIQAHMYSSEPSEWPLLDKGIAYYVDTKSNGQIHLLGNIIIWYTGTISVVLYTVFLIFYVIRRRRLCYDLSNDEWQRFISAGNFFFIGYLVHYLPYFFVDRTLFLHHYLPAFLFKLLLLCYMFDHCYYVIRLHCSNGKLWWSLHLYCAIVLIWLMCVAIVFLKFLPLSYGIHKLTANEVINLRWKDTWDFIIQRDLTINHHNHHH